MNLETTFIIFIFFKSANSMLLLDTLPPNINKQKFPNSVLQP